ncbi:MAG: efflux RND transporter periplasmic adaptor subunit [Deltaproteobacteria bacterium]|nr:efflux RND transporter periplasmic adaptor subunit [Deltaproteobacteria bacterium]
MSGLIRILILTFLVAFSACDNGAGEISTDTGRIPVSVITARERVNPKVLRLCGTVEANRAVKAGFKIGGKIRSLTFEEGQLVRKGALLARLDPTELLEQKRKAEEQESKARRDLDRMEKLYGKGTVPLSSFQDAASLHVSAEAELNIVNEQLENCELPSPLTGRVTKKLSEVGEVVGPGTPVALLTEMDPILVKAAAPDHLLPQIHPGQTVDVEPDRRPPTRFQGKVTRIESSADPLSRTFHIEVLLENPDEALRPGLIVRVEVIVDPDHRGIVLPLDAVLDFGTDPSVFVVREGTAHKRSIAMGEVRGSEVELLQGLAPGDMVVVSGQEYLKDRQPVAIDRELNAQP